MRDPAEFVPMPERHLGVVTTPMGVLLMGLARTSHGNHARKQLAAIYYGPIDRTMRRIGYSVNQAADIAGRIAEMILEGKILESFDPKEARFREYLLGILRHEIQDDLREEARRREVPLDEVGLASPGADPAEILDREVAWKIFLDALRGTQKRVSKAAWNVFLAHDLVAGSNDPRTQAEMAGQKGVSVGEFRAMLYAARRQFGHEVVSLLAAGLAHSDQVDPELAWFFEQIRLGPPPDDPTPSTP